jgi:hypothetical protein
VSLSVKGKDPQSAVVVLQMKSTQGLLFGFEKVSLPLTAADKEVLFTFKLSMIAAKAKFELKDMIFDGVLAV